MRIQDEISIRDLTPPSGDPEVFYDAEPEVEIEKSDFSEQDSEVDSKKVLGPKEEVYFDFSNQKPCRQCRYAQKRLEELKGLRLKHMPTIRNKTQYLELVNAHDCIKDKVTGCYLTQIMRANPITSKRKHSVKLKSTKTTSKPAKPMPDETKLSKIELKEKRKSWRQTLKYVWATKFESQDSEKENEVQVPSHYKRYIVQDQKILLQTPDRERPQPRTSYDGPEDTKCIDIAELGEDP